ncbi:MAG: orotidine-5'-phosphate decarboxylase [Candidatus Kapaibacterium sp.]
MTILERTTALQSTNSMLCVGLDSSLDKLPAGIPRTMQGLLEFNRHIIDATKDVCSAYKLNFAFYEQYGHKGVQVLEETVAMLPSTHIRIADAKRGDIGNTAEAYARSVFEHMPFDSVTVSPYMGADSVIPFLAYSEKLVFILALTSNPGSHDIQRQQVPSGTLYEHVMQTALQWEGPAEKGFVVGATHAQELALVRSRFAHVPFLIPGVGAQGADPADIRRANAGGPAFVNSSRAILYASSGSDFARRARQVAQSTAAELQA